jgi:hypothetical protein
MQVSRQTSKQVSFKAASIQKFPLDSLVVMKNNKPWFCLDPKKVLTGVGIVRYYAPEAGYQVQVQDQTMWYSEDALESAENNSFDLQAFIKGQKARTRSGCTAKFLQTNKENLVYQIKAEVQYKDGAKTLQDYSKSGAVNAGVKCDLDLVEMVEAEKVEPLVNSVNALKAVNVQPIRKNILKVIMQKEIEIKKSKVEKELEQAIAEDAEMLEVKANSERYEWLTNYMTSSVQIDFVDLQLKLATNKQEFNATIDKLKTQIKFKA